MRKFLDNNLFKDITIKPYLTFGEDQKVFPEYKTEVTSDTLTFSYECNDFSDKIVLKKVQSGVVATRKFKNLSNTELFLHDLSIAFDNLDFGGKKGDDYFYSVENPRIYETFTFPIDYNRTADDVESSEYDVIANNRWADPGVVSERINDSPYQPFPAILLSNYKSTLGFVHGTLCQDVFFHSYLVRHSESGVMLDCSASFKAVKYLSVAPGRVLVDEWYAGITNQADDINNLFNGYTEELRKKLAGSWGTKDINRHELVWGSWNDGLFRDVSHEMLINEAKSLKEKFPTVEWFQLDDGYAKFHDAHDENTAAHGIGVAYAGDEGVDYNKFPEGLKKYADDVRATGFNPAIWIGGYTDKKAAVYRDHPDWFINYDYRLKNAGAFDFSVKEARDFLSSGLDMFLNEFGFEAVKHDFWSYQFETSGDFYKNLDKSGYEYRDWWCSEMRKRVPEYGYLESCCDLAQGNPFLGKYFNNYRYGIDVAAGKWDNIKATIQWGTACMSTHTGDLYVPNSDSIGLFPALTFDEFLYWTNHVLITRSMVELAGLYTKKDADKKRVEVLRKATCCINNGDNAYFANFDYRKSGKVVPELVYINDSFFSLDKNEVLPCKTVAVFNPDEEEKTVTFALSDLGLSGEYFVTDVWGGKTVKISDKLETKLRPHASALYSINKIVDNAILDSDLKLDNVKAEGNALTFSIPYKREGEIKFASALKSVNVKEGKGEIEGNTLKLSAKENCIVEITF